MRITHTGLLLAALVLAACDHQDKDGPIMSTPPRPTIRLDQPDPAFALTAEQKAKIRPGFDVDALERLLAAVEPDARPMILEPFLVPPPGEPVGNIIKMGDPELQPLLDQVWAPMWEELPPEAIDTEDKDFPGREVARVRRSLEQ